jgi:hypothetical protein
MLGIPDPADYGVFTPDAMSITLLGESEPEAEVQP